MRFPTRALVSEASFKHKMESHAHQVLTKSLAKEDDMKKTSSK